MMPPRQTAKHMAEQIILSLNEACPDMVLVIIAKLPIAYRYAAMGWYTRRRRIYAIFLENYVALISQHARGWADAMFPDWRNAVRLLHYSYTAEPGWAPPPPRIPVTRVERLRAMLCSQKELTESDLLGVLS